MQKTRLPRLRRRSLIPLDCVPKNPYNDRNPSEKRKGNAGYENALERPGPHHVVTGGSAEPRHADNKED